MTNFRIRRIIRKAEVSKYEFTFSHNKNDFKDYMYYSDSYFLVPSTYLNRALLTQSLSLTMACFASGEADYSSKFQNGINLLTRLDFHNIETNIDFKNKPNADSLGIIFASKKIKKYTLVCAVIRSANYESEWASNFKIGSDKNSIYHKGFFEASEIYLESLKYYLTKNNIKGKIKLWTMGFSRGAISNNIASGRIDEMIEKKKRLFDRKIKLSRDNLYSFCFESPRGVFYDEKNYPKQDKFNNIYCILNFNDAVTKVVPRTLNCTRFGRELYLPDYLNNYDFKSQEKKIIKQYEKMPNTELLGPYVVSNFSMVVDSKLSKIFAGKNKHLINWTQGLYLEELLDVLGETALISRENYTALFQDGIRSVLLNYYASEEEDKSILSSFKTKDKIESTSMSLFIKTLKKTLLSRKELLFPLIDKGNLAAIKSAHNPELCLAFLRSMDSNYTNDIIAPNLNGRFYKIQVENQKTDLSIQVDNQMIISYVKGDRIDLDNHFIQGIKKDMIEIYLPADQKYTLSISNNKEYSIEVFEPKENKFNLLKIEPTHSKDKLNIRF